MTKSYLFAAGIIAAYLAATPANADVIYTSFGPSYAFNWNVSFLVCGAQCRTFQESWDEAMPFHITGDYNLDQLDLQLEWAGGPNTALVSLMTNVAGLPGSVLVSWTLTNLPNSNNLFPPVTTISGITGLELQQGDYFIAVSAPDENSATEVDWNENSFGPAGLAYYRRDQGSWTAYPYTVATAAFDVIGTPTGAVPEPITLSLFGTGLAGAVAIRRRQKARR